MKSITYSGLALKCISNGEPPESKDGTPKRFDEKTEDCSTNRCTTATGPTLGDQPLLFCGPSDEPIGCKDKDGNKICLCDTELCNQQEKSPAVQFVTNWILINFGFFVLMRI